MNVCIFCSANDVDKRFHDDAIALGRGIARGGNTLVWGGSNTGLMKICADAAQLNGGKIVGISVERFRDVVRPSADEMIFASDMAERKSLMLDRADVVVALPGGLGTVDELLWTLKLKKLGGHDTPIIVLNTDGFYDGLRQQLETMDRLGFLPHDFDELIIFASSAEAVTNIIRRLPTI